MDIVKGNMGWIEVVVGPMFSGKSEELIRRLRRAEIAKQRVQIFKPVIDQRYAKSGIVSHSGLELDSELVKNGEDILAKVAPTPILWGAPSSPCRGCWPSPKKSSSCSRFACAAGTPRFIPNAW